MNAPTDSYPLRFDVDYPDRPRNRLTTFFRLFTVIPVFIIASIDDGTSLSWTWIDSALSYWDDHRDYDDETSSFITTISSLIFIPAVLMLLFRRKYPRWWFDWNLELLRFSCRVLAYLGLLRDEYPSTDEK